MKIVMLGHSGAGKTTYLSLMYAELQTGVGGFRVHARDGQHHRQLIQDADAIRLGRYPAATHRRACYDLALSYDNAEVMPFSWRDHRGGAASGRTSDAPDVAELNQDLLDSDAIVMFVDGAELVKDPRAGKMFGRLSGHVLRALRGREEFLTPLVIAVTKCDLVDLGNEKVVETLRAPLQELVSAVAASGHVYGTVLPVSCGPSPMNVTVPVLWSLRFGVIGMAMRMRAAVEYFNAAANAAEGKNTLGDRIGSWFRGERTWASIAAQHRLDALRAYREFQLLVPPAKKLDNLLEGVQTF